MKCLPLFLLVLPLFWREAQADTAAMSPPVASAITSPTAEEEALAVNILHHIGLVSQRENHFTETRQLHALKVPLHSEGTLRFIPPDRVEKLTLTPVQDSFIMQGDTAWLRHGQTPARAVPLHMSPALQVMAATIRGPLQGDVALLQQYYTLSATGDMGRWTLTMTPRTHDTGQIVRLVQIQGRNNSLDSLHLVLANGDVTDTAITSP
ncbi:LolA-related protein [Bombella apis]|uniref:LolA-related protein n=1 Tax=Bombella apis TaxID=1785988 RepID=UPI0024A8351F|nr:LolA-related protein [Bombella apis]